MYDHARAQPDVRTGDAVPSYCTRTVQEKRKEKRGGEKRKKGRREA